MRPRLPLVAFAFLALGCSSSPSPARDAGADANPGDGPKAGGSLDVPAADSATGTDGGDAGHSAADVLPDSSGDVGRGEIVGFAECDTAEDCRTRVKPVSAKLCEKTAGWSCIARKCAWECSGARTCDVDTDGCLACAGVPGRQCPGGACQDLTLFAVQDMTCSSPPNVGAWTCFGDWARLASGEYCSVIGLPTGALRYAVTCGLCQTIYYK